MRAVKFMFLGGCLAFAACNTTSSKIPFRKETYDSKQESILYVFRTRAFIGGGVKTVFFFVGKSIGLLPQNGYYPVHTVAGRHRLKGCSASLVAAEDCKAIEIDLAPNTDLAVQIVMYAGDRRFEFEKHSDLTKLANAMNEGDYYDAELRDAMPRSEKRLTLNPAALGGDTANTANAPLQVAILNFHDRTQSELHGWLAASLPDAIDQSMRKDFEYKRPNPVQAQKIADKSPGAASKQLAHDLAANLVISGQYSLNPGGTTVHIEAQIYFADTDTVLGTEAMDAPVDAQIFNATQALAEKLVFRLHQIVRK